MFHIPPYFPKISWKLSNVLRKVGLSEKYVSKRRTAYLLRENIITQSSIDDTGTPLYTAYHFGSSTEVSTTPGLDSDTDLLLCGRVLKCLSSLDDINRNDRFFPYVLVEDESTPPGYCQIYSDRSIIQSFLSLLNIFDMHAEDVFAIDMCGRAIMKIPFFSRVLGERHEHGPAKCVEDPVHGVDYNVPLSFSVASIERTIHGPAECIQEPGRYDADFVPAIHCSVWPKCGERFLKDLNNFDWPHEDVKDVALTNGCFLVPVGFKGSEKKQFEWRLSASLVERSLMFSLNITQIRCYVLLKMIRKAFLNPVCGEAVSSFHCKNVLFRCIRAYPRGWTEENLLKYVTLCLIHLRQCISAERCPNFVFEDSNLLAGNLSKHVQRSLENVLSNLINGAGVWILNLPFDSISHMLQTSLSVMSQDMGLLRNAKSSSVYERQIVNLVFDFQKSLTISFRKSRETKYVRITEMIMKLEQLSTSRQRFVRLAAKLLLKLYISYFASLSSSDDIYRKGRLSKDTEELSLRAVNSSPLCSRLKLASALYCAGDIEKCTKQLSQVQVLLLKTEPICGCPDRDEIFLKSDSFSRHSLAERLFVSAVFPAYEVANCIEFTRDEMYCVPKELRCEMFGSTIEDRKDERENCTESAIVDAQSFNAFLTYLVLGKNLCSNSVSIRKKLRYEQLKAFQNLETLTKDCFEHKETAYNLLGQCYEKEGCLYSALNCYRQSLSVRKRNNTARLHVCRVLWLIFNQGFFSIVTSELQFAFQAKHMKKMKRTGLMRFGTFEDSRKIGI